MRPRDEASGARAPASRTPTVLAGLMVMVAAAALLSSCAYYNTFYLARKYYDLATNRQPYIVDRTQATDVAGAPANFRKSIDYSKKVLAQYPKSKWVDDAYLLWARALLYDDPLQTINMLQDFTTRYPKSAITPEARFYLGVAYRQARKYREAVATLDEFLAMSPKHSLVPYAYLERARALGSLERWPEAAASTHEILERYKKSALVTPARLAHAEAAFNQGDYASARQDYVILGHEARNDEDRLIYLFREADCLEAARQFDEELRLLTNAQSHEVPPPSQPDATVPGSAPPPPPANDRYGRIMIRIGTVHLLAGRLEPALTAYRSVVKDYPRTPIAVEAQYRTGYAYETLGDDFAKARDEYAKVRDIGASSVFLSQGDQRAANLGRITQFKGGRDSVESAAEARFLLAEQYLFQLGKPDRALQEYQKIAEDFRGTPWEAKAMTAEAWVMSRKLDRAKEADSLWWQVVMHHAGTEAQLAARDYLEQDGATVADSLIKMPERPLLAAADTTLTPPPATVDSLGARRGAPLLHRGRGPGMMRDEDELLRRRLAGQPSADTTRADPRQALPWTAPDTSGIQRPPTPPLPPPPDTTGARPRHGG